MFEISSNLGQVAAAAGALITIFSLFALLVRGFHWFRRLPTEIRNYLFRPKLILLPSAEEVARYSVKAFDSVKPTAEEIDEEYRGVVSQAQDRRFRMCRMRIMLIAAFFLCLLYLYVARLLYVGLTKGSDEYKGFFTLVLSTLPFLIFITASVEIFYVWKRRIFRF